ncbi:accessory gene regulator B family protein [[Clostridium] polysaccharolyticum]|uniref:Accessory gene regulator B n=1 Tax=[Clostridium] polysaccharolyticum TaxID=29364 RepID=A0A1I0FL93_9FIRM|nr:accessory gene regulator B family protein [[Clostridium] polysaccharolyticum]SET58836.1 accessory gene regulator B [[Clostridium] polysaccharolyticum]
MKAVERLVVKLIADGVIEEEDREIYEYGFHHGIMLIINIACTIAIGIAMKMFWEVLLFLAAYVPLRTNAGGFHAKTQLRCFFYSNFIVAAILFSGRILAGHSLILGVLAMAASIVIVILAPVEDQNKPLDEKEVAVYGKRARRALFLDILLAGALELCSVQTGSATVIASVFGMAVFLIMGYIKNIRLKQKRNGAE